MSQAANHGYSHLSGIDMMSKASKFASVHCDRRGGVGRRGCVGSPSSQRSTS